MTLSTDRRRYHELKAAGLCVKCGIRPAEKGVNCAACRQVQRNYYRQRRNLGLCVDCGLPSDGCHRCPVCRARQTRGQSEREHERTRRRQAERARNQLKRIERMLSLAKFIEHAGNRMRG